MRKQTLVLIGSVFVLTGAFQNCAKANFASSNDSASLVGADGTASPQSCTNYLTKTETPIRLLFVVDESGSNGTPGGAGTDPNKLVRAGSIGAFFNDYQTKTSFGWGFIGFASDAITPFIAANGVAHFSSVASDVQAALTRFQNTADAGDTPYQLAMNGAISVIQHDTSAPSNTKYIVVFLSDGVPNPDVSDVQLALNVTNLLAARPGQVSFSTVYYGSADPIASGRLKNMAATGGGKFLDTNADPAGKDFLIDNVINVPGTNCSSN